MTTITEINNRPLAQVAEFHETFEHPILAPTKVIPAERKALRIRLLREETKELWQGLLKSDLHNSVKELADLYYVFWGAILEYGLYRTIRPSSYEIIANEPACTGQQTTIKYFSWIMAKINDIEAARNDAVLVEAFQKLLRLIDELCQLMGMAVQIQAVFDEVHRSNMSKVFPDGSIRYDEGGKVLKPSTYSPADIEKVLVL